MKHFVYILLSGKDGNFYVGMTKDLEFRLKSHGEGGVESTKKRRPLYLLGYEVYFNKHDAAMREKFLKSSDGRKEIKIRFKLGLARYASGKFFFEERKLQGDNNG